MRQNVSLVDILEDYFLKETLQDFLEQAGLKKSGTKRELAERLVYESNYDPAFFLSKLTKDELLWILEENFGITLPRSTRKQVLIDSLLSKLEGDSNSKISLEENKGRSASYVSKSDSGADIPIEEVVYRSLRSFRPYKFEKESELEGQLVVHLRNTVPTEVTPQKAGAKRGDILVPDIVVDNIAIEVKFFRRNTSKAEWDRSIGQVIRYFLDGNYSRIFLFVVDHAGIAPEDIIKEYERLLPWLKIIVRK